MTKPGRRIDYFFFLRPTAARVFRGLAGVWLVMACLSYSRHSEWVKWGMQTDSIVPTEVHMLHRTAIMLGFCGCTVAWFLLPLLPRLYTHGCPFCGYSLTGNTSGRCPECGASSTTSSRIQD